MNAETLKLFRINLLRQARAAKEFGQSINEFVVGAKAEGHNVDADTVREEIQYLIDKKHLEQGPAEISPEVRSFRFSAGGRACSPPQPLNPPKRNTQKNEANRARPPIDPRTSPPRCQRINRLS